MDTCSAEKRSAIMRKIKSKDTSPELVVRSFLHRKGFRFRLHYKGLPGTPDIVLPKYKTVVFVNGCFWHQHSKELCKRPAKPKSNQEYWGPKLKKNVERDQANMNRLIELGWKVITVWECQLCDELLEKLSEEIKESTVE